MTRARGRFVSRGGSCRGHGRVFRAARQRGRVHTAVAPVEIVGIHRVDTQAIGSHGGRIRIGI